ncbi:bacillithiol biosynthesis deacetylase BshB2 [Lentibacillus sediminis]|uniref:bacillithiol biosynthesis deacetylase BshB2 n=1 Tax=Lentibacillus sediminis TaxID=1940529 RepID=UPI000C1B81DF|nr:bacillithiol biosynthesis deacetylase BshB2 [Lentibacillus sediminis]
MEKHVVVIYPHPDDESFGAAGTMTQFREQGVPVTYLCGTLGEMGRNMGTPTFANRETLPEIRKQELIDACKALDIELRMLGYRDKTLEYEDRGEVAAHLKGILQEIKPSLVITHYPDHAVHPDHNALGAAAIEAVRLMDPADRPTVWAQALTEEIDGKVRERDIVNDVTAQFDTKLQAILAHKSQASPMLGLMNTEDKETIEAVKDRFNTESFFIWKYDD